MKRMKNESLFWNNRYFQLEKKNVQEEEILILKIQESLKIPLSRGIFLILLSYLTSFVFLANSFFLSLFSFISFWTRRNCRYHERNANNGIISMEKWEKILEEDWKKKAKCNSNLIIIIITIKLFIEPKFWFWFNF